MYIKCITSGIGRFEMDKKYIMFCYENMIDNNKYFHIEKASDGHYVTYAEIIRVAMM